MDLKKIINTILNEKIYLVSFFLVIFFYFSTNSFVFDFLRQNLKLTSIDSYLIDQFLLFGVFSLFFFFGITQKQISFSRKEIFIFVGILLLYFLFMLIFQNEILQRYFAKDDYLQVFGYLNTKNGIDQSFNFKGGFFYYQFSFFTLLFKFFRYNALAYNIFGIFFMAFYAAVIFTFLRFLAKVHRIPVNLLSSLLAFLLGCVYLSSPTIMDMYLYMENTVAYGFIQSFLLLSIFSYTIFILNTKKKFSFLLSFLLTIYLLKSAYVRTGFLPLTLIFLETLFLKLNKEYLKGFLIRLLLLLIPFFIRSQVYFIPNSKGRFYTFSIFDFFHFDKIYITFSGLITTFLPYQIWDPIIELTRKFFLGSKDTYSNNFIINNMFFISGIILCIAISIILIYLNYRKRESRISVFIFISAIISMAFFMFFGNTAMPTRSNSYDMPYVYYGDTPGSRYFLSPFLFFVLLFFLLFYLITAEISDKKKLLIPCSSFLLLILLLVSNVIFTQRVNHDVNQGAMIPVRLYTENVLRLIPDDYQEKVLYSTRIVQPIRSWTYDGFATLYTKKNPKYIDTPDELETYLKENKISKNNFYAFNFDPDNLVFKDESVVYREKYSTYLK